MDIEFLVLADPRPSIRPLIRQLDLFEGTDRNWGQRLQATLKEIGERDFSILSRAIGSIAEPSRGASEA